MAAVGSICASLLFRALVLTSQADNPETIVETCGYRWLIISKESVQSLQRYQNYTRGEIPNL